MRKKGIGGKNVGYIDAPAYLNLTLKYVRCWRNSISSQKFKASKQVSITSNQKLCQSDQTLFVTDSLTIYTLTHLLTKIILCTYFVYT